MFINAARAAALRLTSLPLHARVQLEPISKWKCTAVVDGPYSIYK